MFELDCCAGGYVGIDARKTMSTTTVYESLLVGAHGFTCYGTCYAFRVFVVALLLSLRAQLSFVCKGLRMARGASVAFRCACKKNIVLRILHESKRKFKWSCRKIVKPAMCCKRAGWRFACLITKDQLLYAVDCFLACLQRACVDKVCWEVR